jgi:hypothetical protein
MYFSWMRPAFDPPGGAYRAEPAALSDVLVHHHRGVPGGHVIDTVAGIDLRDNVFEERVTHARQRTMPLAIGTEIDVRSR